MKNEFKSIQRYITVKVVYKKFTKTILQKSAVITVRDIKVSFQVKEEIKL